jgi:hypothetical protein
VDFHEGRFIVVGQRHAGGAVGFIADNQVKTLGIGDWELGIGGD